MAETSVSLLGRACGDSTAESWDRLAGIYSPLLRTWISRYQLQESDADDLLQEVLMTVARELPAFEHSGRTGAFRKWLRVILVHRLQNFWRVSKRTQVSASQSSMLDQLAQLEDDKSEASLLWDAEHDQHVVARLIELVRPRFETKTWEAFQRQMFRGEKGREIAVELGMTLKAVQLAKSRVLHALRTEAAGLVDSV